MAAHPTENAIKLPSIIQWSQEHIQAVFESSSDEKSIQAIEETFSSDIKATINGKQVNRDEIKQLVLSMRAGSSDSGGLRIEWKHVIEAPQDTHNRVIFFDPVLLQVLTGADSFLLQNGTCGAFYIIHNIHRRIAGEDNKTAIFERHKAVTVMLVAINSFSFFAYESRNISRIESQSPDTTIDSRRIVNLVFVASERRVVDPS